ncbi:MAG TPA: protein kinase [Thermoanaerobaculia bacterium]|nr:protein kinase [Thermoanaerobaculia bacterium]
MLLTSGTRLRRYEVTATLGAGGMGEVYLARDVELDRTVALKVLPQGDDEGSEERIRRFLQEARAAITLNHPNVAHIYDVGEENGVRFMAMEYVEGETLRARMVREPLSLDAALEIATQVANALGSAHGAGIIHRDVKPENVMLRPDGYVKVLDFGLAKLTVHGATRDETTMVVHTAPGIVMGTMYYMSPEQLRGDDVDARTDVFSLGVMLYEMVSGHRPFEASSASGIIAAILTDQPPPLHEDVPPAVRAIVTQALAKDRNERFANAREMAAALKRAHTDTHRIHSGDVPTEAISAHERRVAIAAMPTESIGVAPRRRVPVAKIAIAAAVLVAVVIGAWFANRARIVREARAVLPKIEQLAEQRRYFEAYDLAKSVQPHLRGEERLVRVLEKITAPISVKSSPAGAQVWVERVTADGETSNRVAIGATPLQNHPLAYGDYVLTIEKNGFAPSSRTIMLTPIRGEGMWIPPPPVRIERSLVETSAAPARMVLVSGGPYRLVSWLRPTTRIVALAPFFIDQFEVSNAEFARFVDGGGYQRSELWKHPFVKDGRNLTFDEAMRELRDTTGLNAPRAWAQQKYPSGRENDPVTGVTWYEAAAYAEFTDKSLPTIYEWEKAARDGTSSPFGLTFPWGVAPAGVDASQRANFRGNGPMPVHSLRGGMSPYGAYHMAGNVEEWCANAIDDGRSTAGAKYESVSYEFGTLGTFPPFYSSPRLGFRCVKHLGASGDQGGAAFRRTQDVAKLPRNPESKYREFLKFYEYPPAPLNARVVKRTVGPAWIVEKIAYAGAGGQTVEAVLFLPKNHRPPYQVVHYLPPHDVAGGRRTFEASIESTLAPFIRSGRAVFGVMLPGYIGREFPGGMEPSEGSEEFAELTVNNIVDERRGLDYLLTRPDVDASRVAFYGQSSGAHVGVLLAGVEHRYRSVLLVGAGLIGEDTTVLPRVSRINFVPYLDTPLLMVHGRWDEIHPLRTEAEPLFELASEPKRLTVYDGSHVPSLEVAIPTFTAWWDETLGPVQR